MKKIDVVCAAIVNNGQVMIARRTGKAAGWYEFPGGKVEPGETKEEALVREIREECGTEIENLRFLAESRDIQDGCAITLYCYTCTCAKRPEQLRVHDEYVWTTPSHIYDYHFFEADRRLVQILEEQWTHLPGHQK